jgi:catechol 2,3-dioxygenase-like lactoylglutathione lyase family enzyme
MGTDLQLEHIAVNVTDPQGMAEWYGEHLGMTVVRKGAPPDHMHFLADSGGRVVLEIYRALPDEVPDYAAMNPLVLHLAFATQDAQATMEKLVAAGASALGDVRVTPAGDHMAMLRDPWGLALQLCQRAESMVA